MTERDRTPDLTRRTALKVTGSTLATGGLFAAGGGTATADQHEDGEEELPPDVAAAAGVDVAADGQAQGAAFHRRGWHISIQSTTDDHRSVRGGDYLAARCRVENRNTRGPHPDRATVWFVVGRDPQVVDRRSITVWGGSTSRTRIGYETYPVRQLDRFPVWVLVDGPGRNAWDMAEVVVYPVR